MSINIIILGTGGNCIDILDTINAVNKYQHNTFNCLGFLDDNKNSWGKKIFGKEVLGPLNSASHFTKCSFINGIGSPFNFWKKQEIIAKTHLPDERFATIVHPSASVSPMSRLSCGTVVLQNTTISANVQIGKHVIILPNSVVSHDSTIGDYSCIAGSVSISGGVTIENSCYLGANSAVIGNIKIGSRSLIGMGSVVINGIDKNSVTVGNPARLLKRKIPT